MAVDQAVDQNDSHNSQRDGTDEDCRPERRLRHGRRLDWRGAGLTAGRGFVARHRRLRTANMASEDEPSEANLCGVGWLV
jgi:hypothetical protein